MGIDQLIPPGCAKLPLTRVGGAPRRRRVCAACSVNVCARPATGNITFSSINFWPSERVCEAISTRIRKTIMRLDGAGKRERSIKSSGERWGRMEKFLRLGDVHGWREGSVGRVLKFGSLDGWRWMYNRGEES